MRAKGRVGFTGRGGELGPGHSSKGRGCGAGGDQTDTSQEELPGGSRAGMWRGPARRGLVLPRASARLAGRLLRSQGALRDSVSPRGGAGRGQCESRSRLQGAPVSSAAGARARAAAETAGAGARAAGQPGSPVRGPEGPWRAAGRHGAVGG